MSIYVNKITGLRPSLGKKSIYRDLFLDLSESQAPVSDALYGKSTKTDLKIAVDEQAILNSLKNIFNTTPGEKILNPSFGLNLSQWLFEPVSEFAAREIGEAILNGITRYEPRVTVNNVSVIADPENSQYIIKLAMTIPQLNINNEYTAVLNSPGFDFISSHE